MANKLAPALLGPDAASVQQLCNLLLQVAGRDTNRLASVQRHARVLDAALPHMTTEQSKVARERIRRFEAKWGPVLSGSKKETETDGILPEMRVANWLSVRRTPERLLKVLHRAACSVWSGETSLLDVSEYAFAYETDRVVIPVGYDSFKEWLIQLRIARHEPGGVYRPGSLCHWWLHEMEPTARKDTSYAACLRLLVSMKKRRW